LGDIDEYLKRQDTILKSLYSPRAEFILCSHININYLNENDHKQQINSLVKTNNLSHTVNFPTGAQNSSSTAIDHIFIDTARLNSSYRAPIINGLSDHDAQFLMKSDINIDTNLAPFKWRLWKINNETIAQFQHVLDYMWEPVSKNSDTDYNFNSFLDTFGKKFEASFPVQSKSLRKTRNDWITQEIKMSCRHKRSLYILNRRSNNPHMKAHYSKYCITLSDLRFPWR
jgi:hypothetical protein